MIQITCMWMSLSLMFSFWLGSVQISAHVYMGCLIPYSQPLSPPWFCREWNVVKINSSFLSRIFHCIFAWRHFSSRKDILSHDDIFYHYTKRNSLKKRKVISTIFIVAYSYTKSWNTPAETGTFKWVKLMLLSSLIIETVSALCISIWILICLGQRYKISINILIVVCFVTS